MPRRDAQTLTAILAALLVAVLGAVSAPRMAPDREAMELRSVLLAMGASAHDVCGVAGDLHEHRCPVCHTLPGAPDISAPDTAVRIARVIAHRKARDLFREARDIRAHASPRAPPRLV